MRPSVCLWFVTLKWKITEIDQNHSKISQDLMNGGIQTILHLIHSFREIRTKNDHSFIHQSFHNIHHSLHSFNYNANWFIAFTHSFITFLIHCYFTHAFILFIHSFHSAITIFQTFIVFISFIHSFIHPSFIHLILLIHLMSHKKLKIRLKELMIGL